MNIRHCVTCFTWTTLAVCPVCNERGELYEIEEELLDTYIEILNWYMLSEINRAREILLEMERINGKFAHFAD